MQPMISMALEAARRAGEVMTQAARQLDKVRSMAKGAADFVTEVDLAAESEILGCLREAFPDHAFRCEESGISGNPNAEYVWVIDPLDGTANFMRGIPFYAVSIGCMKNGQFECGVVFDPIRGEAFEGSRGQGAFLDGHRLSVSRCVELRSALLGTGVPFLGHCEDRLPAYTRVLSELTSQSMGIRRTGSAALDLAYVAAGRLDAYWEVGLAPWDMAAGVLLVGEAGGRVADVNGSDGFFDSGDLVCGTPAIFDAVLEVARRHLGSSSRP